MALSYDAPSPAPVLVAFVGPSPQRRLTVFFRIILAIPLLLVSIFVFLAAVVVTVLAWFAALVIGRLPTFAAEFLPGVLRWSTRVSAYIFLMTDRYPPFTLDDDAAYPVRVTVQPGPLNRAAVLFRIFLAIPAAVVSNVVQNGISSIVAFITWLIVLVNGTMPPALFQALAAALRYQTRLSGYLLMTTSEYPWGLFGDTDTTVFGASSVYGAYPAPAPPGAYGAGGPPGAAGAYGAPPAPTPGTFGAPPPVGSYTPPPPPDPSASFLSAPPSAVAPVPPTLPGVAFTFGGPAYLWGYTDDRSHCGIWSATDLTAPPQMWPISDQGEGWARFRDLEPNAVALADPTPPPPAASWGQPPPASGAPSYGAPAYGAPAYGTPPPMPAYGTPPPAAYGTPPAPPYGAPSSTSTSPVNDPYWRIVLSSGARQLMVVFLVLGAIFTITNRGGFYRFHFHTGNTNSNNALAALHRTPARPLTTPPTIHLTVGPFVRTTSSTRTSTLTVASSWAWFSASSAASSAASSSHLPWGR